MLWNLGAGWSTHYIYGKWFASELCCFWFWRFLVWIVWRTGQDEQQGPGVGQDSGKCVCVAVALERKTFSFSLRLRNTGTVLRATPSALLIVWMLTYRCEASAWMQSSQGETWCFHYLLFIVVVSESHSHGSEALCAGNWLWAGLRWFLRDRLKFGIFLQVLWKNTLVSKWVT